MVSVSDLKNHHLEVLAKLERGPVVIASRNQPAAVLLSPEQWDEIVSLLEDYEDALLTRERLRSAEANSDELQPIADLRSRLQAEGRLDDEP
jgi:prevent-host-death family protein